MPISSDLLPILVALLSHVQTRVCRRPRAPGGPTRSPRAAPAPVEVRPYVQSYHFRQNKIDPAAFES